jgi:hypothetical protein
MPKISENTKNRYYHLDLIKYYRINIPEHSSILNIHDHNDYFGNYLKPAKYAEVDINSNYTLPRDTYDFIIISDTLNVTGDIQLLFHQLKDCCKPETRIFINYYNFLWLPVLNIAEKLKLKNKQNRTNWLNTDDIVNLLEIEGYDVIKNGRRLLFPINIPFLSTIINKYAANLPLLNHLCFTNYLVARRTESALNTNSGVSIIIPARNEAGNIENAVKRIPNFCKKREIIFVEGHSNDQTWPAIMAVKLKYKNLDIKAMRQKGTGKADAVRLGFAKAHGDIFMILDADLSVPPEDLPKFYNAIVNNNGEFINGCRLVYPMEKQAMQFLNILGNHFFSLAFSWILNLKIKDTLCGTKVLSRNNYEKIEKNRHYFGDFDPFGDYDLIFGAAKLNLKFTEIPIHYKSREYGKTNISRFKHGLLLFKMVSFALNKIKFV